jgi:hypothetical protein
MGLYEFLFSMYKPVSLAGEFITHSGGCVTITT